MSIERLFLTVGPSRLVALRFCCRVVRFGQRSPQGDCAHRRGRDPIDLAGGRDLGITTVAMESTSDLRTSSHVREEPTEQPPNIPENRAARSEASGPALGDSGDENGAGSAKGRKATKLNDTVFEVAAGEQTTNFYINNKLRARRRPLMARHLQHAG